MPTEKEFWNMHHKEVRRLDHPYTNSNGGIYEYRLQAEAIIGRHLLPTEQVHHRYLWDGSYSLMVCKNQQEHSEIHLEEEAFRYSGHWDWRKCTYCKKHDDPKNLSITTRATYHKLCHNEYHALRRLEA